MAFEIRSGNEAALVVGDAIPNSHVAFEKPDWPSGADHDGDAAARTRRALLDQLASEGMPFIGFHIPDSGIGRVERRGDGFHFISEA
jgi:glyoxylase-like metal-dependent hydrolase (beta-lactamase superfamily II)